MADSCTPPGEVYYFWTITDEVTRRRRKTRHRMDEQTARERHGDDAVKVEGSGVTYQGGGTAGHVQRGPQTD